MPRAKPKVGPTSRNKAWPKELQDRAVELYAEKGCAIAARETGVPKPTVVRWARARGIGGSRAETSQRTVETMRSMTAASVASREAKKATLGDQALTDAEKVLKQLWEPVTLYHWGTGEGPNAGTVHLEQRIAQPTFDQQKTIAQTFATLVEKANLLQGDATSRNDTGQVDPQAARERVEAMQEQWRLRAEEKAGRAAGTG